MYCGRKFSYKTEVESVQLGIALSLASYSLSLYVSKSLNFGSKGNFGSKKIVGSKASFGQNISFRPTFFWTKNLEI